MTMFQSRRRRQKQQNHPTHSDNHSQSTDRELPIHEPQTGILRRAGKKQSTNVQVPTGTSTNDKAALETPAREQPVMSQTDSPTMWQRDNDSRVTSLQQAAAAAATDAGITARTQKSDLNHLVQSSALAATSATYGTTTGTGTSPDRQGSERAVLIFDRETRANPSDETLQEKNVERNQVIIFWKIIGAVVSIAILLWLVTYLPTKIVEGGQRLISVYHNFTSRMHTLGHILRVGFTVAAWAGTMYGWGYLAKNTRKFIERRRSDLNPSLLELNNLTDDCARTNHYEKRNSRANSQGTIQVNNLTVSTQSRDNHTSQIE